MRIPTDEGRVPVRGLGSWLARRSDGHRLHAGVDLRTRRGQPVRAPEGGVIVQTIRASAPSDSRAGSSPPGWAGYGPHAVLLHGDSGWYHLLSHIDAPIALGTRVAEGDEVGIGSRLMHVHWEVRAMARPPMGVATVEICADPASWLASAPVMFGDPSREWPSPEAPVADRRTPRRSRPGFRGPAPLPFPHPSPRPSFGTKTTTAEGAVTSQNVQTNHETGGREDG